MSEIKFGTDGWRAILNEDFTYKNTDKVINGIASYIYKYSSFNKKIIVGYDPRNQADNFAFYIAEKLSSFGFDVEASDKIVATPVLAYAALNKNAYAIMITASHNPPEYLGIKFIPPYGGPAEDSMVKEIIDNLETQFKGKTKKEFKKVSFENEYITHIKSLINFDILKKVQINYDGHHGAAAHLFKKLLDENNIKNDCQNIERDINFGGHMPDPKEKYLPELKEKCIKTGLIGLSNDGDGDRFGVFNEKGEFISANDIIALLIKHLKSKGINGILAKTVGASSSLNLYAKQNDIEVIETPVGFKWLGSAMRNNDVLIAGEESGGLSIKGHIPEKDGIIANLLIIEMLAMSGKKLYELQEDLYKSLGRKFINDRIDLKLNSKEEQQEIIDKFKTFNKIGEYEIINKNTMDGLKLTLNNDNWILIRKSGTEPLLRIYFETNTEEKLNELKLLVKNLC
ncbi:MAG: phosphoglucomutase/phosphomannomutase family protein [Cyanobacteria bacterium SIG29]|nr:phosphoglucomutase/phosphomannomutase family protein [Cyanobacteria bacterium SIG29]